MAETENKRKLPPLVEYQKRCVEGGLAAFRAEKDLLIEAPTGAGKTPMIARLASESARSGYRTLVLTHRKLLFNQMVGRPEADTEKKRLGEINYWGGVTPGTIADASMGGVDQNPLVVVGMVETVAARLDILKNYDRIIVDETQHLSEQSSTRENLGGYAQVIEALPDARLAGLTATTFRGDKDKLHPRLEGAHREVVAIDEARSAGRIVPAKTVIGKARTEQGYTPEQLVKLEAEGKIKSASAVLQKDRGDAYYNRAVQDWDTIAKRRKTIVFVDSIAEVQDMTERFCKAYGEGVAVCLHGGKNPDGKGRTPAQNAHALTEYDQGSASILVACQMIGEGFDVPDTDAVMSLNSSLSRLEMNQYVGRSVRAAKGKSYGLFIDYGTASHRHGLIEHQHEMQNVDALAAAGTKITSSRVIGRMAPVQEGAWRAVPGEKTSLFLRSNQGRYEIYHFDHEAEKKANRRPGKNNSSVTKFSRLDHKEYGTKMLDTAKTAHVLAAHAKDEAEYYARMEGVGSEAYRKTSRDMLDHWSPSMKAIDETSNRFAQGDETGKARRAALDASMQGSPAGAASGRMLKKALQNSKSGMDMVRACLDLSGDVLSTCSARSDLPFGVTAEARAVAEGLAGEDFKSMKPGAMRKEALAASAVMSHMTKSIQDEGLREAIGNVSDPLRTGIDRLTREMVAAKRRKTTQRT